MGGRDRGAARVVAVALLLSVGWAAPAAGETVTIPSGSTRVGDLVVSGRLTEVAGRLEGTLVSVASSVVLTGRVTGDVVLLGSDAVLSGRARVDGRLLAVGGEVRFEDGASAGSSVVGSVLTVRALEAAFLAELQTSPLRNASVSPLLLSFRLLILTGWLAISLLLLFFAPRRVTRAAGGLDRLPVLLAVGAAAVLTGLLLSVLALALLPARAGMAVAGVLLVGLFLAKALGMAPLFLATGRLLTRRARRGSPFHGDPAALAIGLLALGAVSLLPAAGPVLWGGASLAAIGLALRSGDPEPASAPRLTSSHAPA